MLLHLSSAKDAGSIKENEKHEIMKQLSERLTRYVINAGAVPEELYINMAFKSVWKCSVASLPVWP